MDLPLPPNLPLPVDLPPPVEIPPPASDFQQPLLNVVPPVKKPLMVPAQKQVLPGPNKFSLPPLKTTQTPAPRQVIKKNCLINLFRQ